MIRLVTMHPAGGSRIAHHPFQPPLGSRVARGVMLVRGRRRPGYQRPSNGAGPSPRKGRSRVESQNQESIGGESRPGGVVRSGGGSTVTKARKEPR